MRTVERPSSSTWDFVRRYSDLASSAAILSLNSSVLLQKAVPRVPALVGHVAQAALSYVGVLSLPTQRMMLGKAWDDFRRAVHASDLEGASVGGVELFSRQVDLAFMLGNCFVAAARLAGQAALTILFYTYTRPLALLSLAATISLEVYDFCLQKRVVKRIDLLLSSEDGEIQRLFQRMLARRDDEFSHKVVHCLDAATWDTLSCELATGVHQDPERARQILQRLRRYCVQKHEVAAASVGLRALGYLSMAICRAYPDTLLQATTLWMMSAFYTAKLVKEKVIESSTRCDMVAALGVAGKS